MRQGAACNPEGCGTAPGPQAVEFAQPPSHLISFAVLSNKSVGQEARIQRAHVPRAGVHGSRVRHILHLDEEIVNTLECVTRTQKTGKFSPLYIDLDELDMQSNRNAPQQLHEHECSHIYGHWRDPDTRTTQHRLVAHSGRQQ
eukprot:228439-Prymnesium_polylepis.2